MRILAEGIAAASWLLLVATAASAEEKVEPGRDGVEANKAAAPEPVRDRRKLARKVSFELIDTPVLEAITFMQVVAKVGIIVDPRVATSAAAQRKITLRVTDLPFDEALDKFCKEAGLDWDTRNKVYISTPEGLRTNVKLEIYDIKDLVDTEGQKDLAQQIRELKPDLWTDASTSIEECGGKLVVMQTPAIHKEIQAYLEKLRDKKPAKEAEKEDR